MPEEGIRIEISVAHVVVGAAVPLVRAGLGDFRNDAAAVAAVFRGVIAFEDPEFLNCVWIWIEDDTVVEQVLVEAAVEKERDGIRAAAADAVAACASVVRI